MALNTSHSRGSVGLPHVHELKGSYEQVGALNTYITGDKSASKGIIDVYDAFGLTAPTLQGADCLAAKLGCLVIVPDYFKGEPASLGWIPPDTDEKKVHYQKFMSEKALSPDNYPALIQSAADAKATFSNVQSWGVLGLCWGGKLAALASGAGTPFKVSGQVHPSRLAREDAEKMTIPHICLASPTDGAEAVKAYAEVLKGPGMIGEVETYDTMFHGWMGARANLQDEKNASEYERGYTQVANFFIKYL